MQLLVNHAMGADLKNAHLLHLLALYTFDIVARDNVLHLLLPASCARLFCLTSCCHHNNDGAQLLQTLLIPPSSSKPPQFFSVLAILMPSNLISPKFLYICAPTISSKSG